MENYKMKIAALVPMRHHSQRVPGKNYRPLAGRPLYQHIIQTLCACPEIDEIVVDTDSPLIIDGLRQDYPVVPNRPPVTVIERPEHLRADDISMNEVLIYDTNQVSADFYLQTHSTNPLLRTETVSRAIKSLVNSYPAQDSLFSVTRWQTRLYDQLGRAINHNPAILLQTQDLPPVYEENSCLYIFTREILVSRRHRIGDRPLLFEIEASEAWDIDEELDFAVVNFLITSGLASI
jgi:CMP-N-acetylneuraminic acid synthetase